MKHTQKQILVTHWKRGGKRSLRLAMDVFEKKYYDHALFCGHLAVEKYLKALVLEKTGKPVPHSHDLLYLAGLANLDLDIEQQKFLVQVNSYNIAGRYQEEQLDFHKQITKSVASKALDHINTFFVWLQKQ